MEKGKDYIHDIVFHKESFEMELKNIVGLTVFMEYSNQRREYNLEAHLYKKSYAQSPATQKEVSREKRSKPSTKDFTKDKGERIVLFQSDKLEKSNLGKRDDKKKTEKSYWDRHFRFSGFAQIFGAVDTEEENSNEHFYTFRNKIRAKLRYDILSERRKTHIRSRRSPYFIFSGESDYLWFGEDNEYDDYDLDIYEAYFNLDEGPFQVRAGKQIVRWGKTDQMSPVDVINPHDMRQFIIPDLEERKIPVWMLKTTLFFDHMSLQGVYIPFFEPNEINFFGTDWAVFRHFKQDIAGSRIDPALKDYFRDLELDRNEPSDAIDNGQLGARLSTSLQDVDVALSYFYGFDPTPHFSSFPVKNISVEGSIDADNLRDTLSSAVLTNEDIEVDYLRSQMVGLDFETTIGKFGVRGESAYFDSRSFLTDALTSVEKESVFTVLGADYLGEREWYANLQVAHQRVFDHVDDILYFQRDNWSLMGELSKEFMRGKIEIGAEGVYFLSDESFFSNPWISYEIVPALNAEIGLHLFGGEPNTVLGQYDENDQGYLKMEYHF
jgi:hypothetical protein